MSRRPVEVVVVVHRPAPGGPEYLVLLRAPEREAYWHLVSGGVEWGEEPHEAAARELGEETGLVATVNELDYVFEYPLTDESDWVRSRFAPDVEGVRGHAYAAEAPAGWEPVLDEEHSDWRWCSADEAVATLFWPEPQEAVRRLARALEGGV